jgi:hypothetical protein
MIGQLHPVDLGFVLFIKKRDVSVASSEPGSDPALPVDGMVRSLLLGLLHQRVSQKTFLGLLNFFLKYTVNKIYRFLINPSLLISDKQNYKNRCSRDIKLHQSALQYLHKFWRSPAKSNTFGQFPRNFTYIKDIFVPYCWSILQRKNIAFLPIIDHLRFQIPKKNHKLYDITAA